MLDDFWAVRPKSVEPPAAMLGQLHVRGGSP